MGPCSLRSIKEGEVDLKYDARFVLAEVNSDVINWQKNEETSRWEVVKINRSHVGMLIWFFVYHHLTFKFCLLLSRFYRIPFGP